jgi:thioesterase domain-containing protein
MPTLRAAMTADPTDLTAAFERELLADIPLARAMQLRVGAWDGERLCMSAPLAPNINDKGCAFGGSLASLMTLAGWGLIVLRLRALERRCDVYVQDSSLRYLAPVWGELVTEARLADGESWDSLLPTLDARGRARLRVACRVAGADGADAVSFEARFVAFAAPAGA